jgi:hypothetical protein
MAKAPKLERPCSNCHHLHEGIPCMEDGCNCPRSVPAEVPQPQIDMRTDSEVGAAELEARLDASADRLLDAIEASREKMTDEEREVADREAQAILDRAVANQGPIPLQERIANLIEDFEDENGRAPIGCELVISGRVYAWTGEKMEEVPAAPTVEPPPAPTTLSEEDQAKLREYLAEQTPVKELPDGSVMLPLRIDADQIEILKSWAEGAGEHWVSYVQRTLEIALNATINGGAVAG